MLQSLAAHIPAPPPQPPATLLELTDSSQPVSILQPFKTVPQLQLVPVHLHLEPSQTPHSQGVKNQRPQSSEKSPDRLPPSNLTAQQSDSFFSDEWSDPMSDTELDQNNHTDSSPDENQIREKPKPPTSPSSTSEN